MYNTLKSLKLLTKPVLIFTAALYFSNLAYAELPPLPGPLKAVQPSVKVTLLEFSAPWCVSCQLLKPELKKLQSEMGPSLRIVDLNIEQPANQPYVKRYEILSTPTILLFNRSGKALQKLENDFTAKELRQLVLKQLAKSK
jgi:protein disulfide-isomerase A6